MNLASMNPLAHKMESLHELFEHELQDIYSAERQLLKALPKMSAAATSRELKMGLKKHLKETEGHVKRLDKIAEKLDIKLSGKSCKGMEGIIKEGDEVLAMKAKSPVRDVALISAAQRGEHYEIAAYGTVAAYAKIMKHTAEERMLRQTLKEEEMNDKKLTKLAMSDINKRPKMH